MKPHCTLLAIALAAIAMSSCKTTEANYRAAYEKVVADRNGDDDDLGVYGKLRKQINTVEVIAGSDTIPVKMIHVSVTTDKGEAARPMRRYCVAVGQFKQRFNAMSLKERLVAQGYADAFVVATSEPYYYVVASDHDSAADASEALAEFERTAPVAMRDPLPFILADPRTSLR